MVFHRYSSPTEMLRKAESYLMENEAVNNLPLGLLHKLKKEEDSINEGDTPLLAVGETDNGSIGMVLVRTPPQNLVICGYEQFVQPSIEWLLEQKEEIPGVVGCKPVVDIFAETWKEKTDCELQEFMRQRIYRLDRLKPVPRQKGKLCYATENDLAIVTYWTELFHQEALEPIDKQEALDFVKREIKNNSIFIWRNEQGTPVSMAKRGRSTANGVVVSLVYTPNEYKKQGFATTCVAAVTERLLNEGYKFCSLYTDLNNPVSNSIYMKIGYEPISDSLVYRFK